MYVAVSDLQSHNTRRERVNILSPHVYCALEGGTRDEEFGNYITMRVTEQS